MKRFPKGGHIIAMNHSQKIDPLHLMGRRWRIIHFLAKQELFETWIGRWFHLWMEEIPVNRQAGDNKKAIAEAVKVLEKGEIVGIFPEGTTKPIGVRPLMKPHTGVARLALMARVPVVPVGIAGNLDAWRKKTRKRGLERQYVIVGKPMYFKEFYGQEDDPEVLRLVSEMVMDEVDKLIDEGDSIRLGKPVHNAGKDRNWENEDKAWKGKYTNMYGLKDPERFKRSKKGRSPKKGKAKKK
jgi:1-acyl-sn-glycerol-3-phosphate acyltransferase